ncbi:MAG: nucleoside hydrolase [Eubacterium sp.]
MMGKIPVILDCDNTMGVPGCDVDDGMALLYLLGCPDVRLLGVTCAYGNNTQDTVYENTVRLLKLWGRSDIPVWKGAESAEDKERNDASVFLRTQAEKYSGDLIIIATGSMSNLKGAERLKKGFFQDVKCFSLMGGITEPLLVGGKPMAELNLSCDPPASLQILRNGADVRIATAQNSLHSFIEEEEFRRMLAEHPGALADFLSHELDYWFAFYHENYGLGGFVCWDVMAAAQALHPEYFQMIKENLNPTEDSLQSGMLKGDGPETGVILPEIQDRYAYTRHVYDTIFRADICISQKG